MDGGVVQVIQVGRSLDEEGVVTWSGCCLARMSLPGF